MRLLFLFHGRKRNSLQDLLERSIRFPQTGPEKTTLFLKRKINEVITRAGIETSVADERVLVQVFAALDLEITFRYEKYREEYSAPGVLIAIDETPVGTYVEIEGSEDGIVSAAAALGRRPSDFMVESYRGLFMRHREQLGLQGPHMLFELE